MGVRKLGSQAVFLALALVVAGGCASSERPTDRADAGLPIRRNSGVGSQPAVRSVDASRPVAARPVLPRTGSGVARPGGAGARKGSGAAAAPARPGVASYYGHKYHGRRTASGERFDMHKMTAAHRTLPFGTRVRVTHRATGRAVTVRVNDRGPFVAGRVIDLSYAAAQKLGIVKAGVAEVTLDVLGPAATAVAGGAYE